MSFIGYSTAGIGTDSWEVGYFFELGQLFTDVFASRLDITSFQSSSGSDSC